MAEKLSERVFALADTLGLVAAEVATLQQQLADAQRQLHCGPPDDPSPPGHRCGDCRACWMEAYRDAAERAAAIERVNRDAAESLSRIALALNCLPSSFADGYGHVEQRAAALARSVDWLASRKIVTGEYHYAPGEMCSDADNEALFLAWVYAAARASAASAPAEEK